VSDDEEFDDVMARGDNARRAEVRAENLHLALTAFIGGNLGSIFGPGSSSCSPCPFAEAELSPYPPNRYDPDEGHYTCHLLNRARIWGEGPACSDQDWRDRARAELEALKCAPTGDPPDA